MNWEQLSNAGLDEVLAWARTQPWAEAMAACQQDAGWHSEGDVWTHTEMVCRELWQLKEWDRSCVDSREAAVLTYTALFHDAAKPLTSQLDPVTGRIRSPKHAVKGEQLVRSVLRDLGCDLATREEIAHMVRYHGRPAFLLEKPDPVREVIMLSWLLENRLLYLFALADTRGRHTEEMTRPEENLHFWRMMAEEQGCLTNPYRFANDQARFQYFRKPDSNLFYVPHEEYRSTVTMMAGLPGSGKDHWLATHGAGLPVVSLDEVRDELDVEPTDNQGEVVQLARERCRELLRSGTSFAFNATNLLRQTRQRWIDLFVDYGARIEIVYVEPPLKVIYEQNGRRESPVPKRVIRELAEKVEPPTWGEAHSLTLTDGR